MNRCHSLLKDRGILANAVDADAVKDALRVWQETAGDSRKLASNMHAN